MPFTALAGCNATDNISSVINHFLRVESSDTAGKSLHDDGCCLVEEDAHFRSSLTSALAD